MAAIWRAAIMSKSTKPISVPIARALILWECDMVQAQTLSARDLMREMRISQSGDWWGDTMGWWFAVAGEMYERGLDIPTEWKYRPSPLGGKEPDQYETEVCEAATDSGLLLFGRALNRYAGMLKAAGKDY